MFALVVALAATILLTPTALAQNSDGQYTVWSSVIFQRTGERTPEIIRDNSPVTLTSIGANQAYEAGAWFRRRYIDAAIPSNRNGTNGAFNAGAPLWGLNADIYSSAETYAISLDQQFNVATASAFFQGLYPPIGPSQNGSVSSTIDPTGLDAENQYILAPLNGYQYPQIHTADGFDPNFIYLSGNLDCPAFDSAAGEYLKTTQYSVTQEQFDGIYDAIGSALLQNVIPLDTWDYRNAYPIYDYLSYQYNHNSTAQDTLNRYRDVATNTSYLTILRDLSSEQQYAQLGNLSQTPTFSTGETGGISTIAGNYLAARILSQLQQAIASSGTQFKLNLLFADFYPLLSLFALTQLPAASPNFYGTPAFASSAVFELFSYSNASFPAEEDLWVKFYFRNGTSDEDAYQSYSLFDLGPSQAELPWADFQQQMAAISVGSVGEWCTLCGATNLFCSAYNASQTRSWLDGSGSFNNSHRGLAPALAGLIGALVALAVAACLFAASMLLFGIRLHRRRSPKSELGGFKGGAKMASDQDLTIPKGGGGAEVVEEQQGPMSPVVAGGHERVGSWELKSKDVEAGNLRVGLSFPSARGSLEEMGKRAEPSERV
ncbi:hypothetical protein M409DRAFT_26876 [Zasmidium cellare ATCC 36951]|uniref:Phosphoglycerate mutase-like protein n=1 Tax=Zasmidium cellare ATCC 36951 TaxID=1080233 RepID=A0A6A6C6A1_ZASCE|nr:uncharacterized protein M409DRAFT_26876 [Zasmidium cellare ATCC 36951]KAF2162634.1 hypothetical protein M409DRAFT_26876 [Zasmidium cellare ATCC 36951]